MYQLFIKKNFCTQINVKAFLENRTFKHFFTLEGYYEIKDR